MVTLVLLFPSQHKEQPHQKPKYGQIFWSCHISALKRDMPLYHTHKDHCSLLLWHCTSDDCQTPIYHTPSVSNQLLRYIKCLLRQPEALRPPSPLCLLLRDLKNVRNWSLSTQSSLGSPFVTPLWLWHKALGWVVQSLLFLTHLYFFRYGLVFTPAYSIELCHSLDRTQLSIQITVYQAV